MKTIEVANLTKDYERGYRAGLRGAEAIVDARKIKGAGDAIYKELTSTILIDKKLKGKHGKS